MNLQGPGHSTKNLQALPNELLEHISAFIGGRSFESLALTSKRLFTASGKYIDDHNTLSRRYRRFAFTQPKSRGRRSFWPCGPDDVLRSSLELLLRIARQPVIAQYIEYADLRHDTPGDHASIGVRTLQEFEELEKGERNPLRDLVERSKYLRAAGVDVAEWLSHMINQYRAFDWCANAPVLLLTLLPNVKELALPHLWQHCTSWRPTFDDVGDVKDVWKVLSLLPQRTNHDRDQGRAHQAALAGFETLYPNTGTKEDDRLGLDKLMPLLSISSTRNFLATSVIAYSNTGFGMTFEPAHSSFGVNLERIEMAASCVDAVHITQLLGATPKLRVFKFSYQSKEIYTGYHWDAGHFVAAVEREVGEHLEELSVSCINCHGSMGTGVVSLRGFWKLKELEISTDMLLGPPYGGDIDRTWYGDKSACAGKNSCCHCTGSTASGPSEVPSLIKLLPPTVEKLRILTDQQDASVKCLQALFKDLDGAGIKKAFPILRTLGITVGEKGRNIWKGHILTVRDARWSLILYLLKSLRAECTECRGQPKPRFMGEMGLSGALFTWGMDGQHARLDDSVIRRHPLA